MEYVEALQVLRQIGSFQTAECVEVHEGQTFSYVVKYGLLAAASHIGQLAQFIVEIFYFGRVDQFVVVLEFVLDEDGQQDSFLVGNEGMLQQ